MSLQRSVGSLLARRFSPRPRAIPRTAPARSLHSSLKDFPIADGIGRAAVVAAAALACAGALAHQYFSKGPADDESAARRKEEDLKVRFEDWAKKYKRTYRDEEEKVMRFQVFKDTVDWIESLPPSTRDLRPLNCFADFKPEECPLGRSGQCCIIDIDGHGRDAEEEYLQNKFLAENENGEAFVWKPAVKHGDKQATQVSA